MSRHDYDEGTQRRQKFSPHSHSSTRRVKNDSPASAQGSTAPVYTTSTSTTTGIPQTVRTYTVSHNGRSVDAAEKSTGERSKHRQAGSQPVIVTRTSRDRRQDDDSRVLPYRSKSPRRDDRILEQGAYAVPDATYTSRGHRQRQHEQPSFTNRTTSLDRVGERGTHRRSHSHSHDLYAPSVINYGDEGYKYTTVGDLVKFDLDQPTQPRAASRHHGSYYPKLGRSHATTDTAENQNYTPYAYRHGNDYLQPPIPRDESEGRRYRHYASSPRQPTPRDFYSSRNENEYRKDNKQHANSTRPSSSSHHEMRGMYQYADDRNTIQPRDVIRTGRRAMSPAEEFQDERVENRGFGIVLNRDSHDNRESHRRETSSPSRRHTVGGHSTSTLHNAGVQDGSQNQRVANRQSQERHYLAENDHPLKQQQDRTGDMSPLKSSVPIGFAALAAYDTVSHGDANSSMQVDGEKPSALSPAHAREDMDRLRTGDELKNDKVPEARVSRAYSMQPYKQRSHPNPDAIYDRKERPHSFNPNDTEDLLQLQKDLVALKVQDSAKTAASSLENDLPNAPDARGRLSQNQVENQLRLVSPPRDKAESRPLRGILKQPKVSFPEESNPIREGVAPHKEDKKLKDAPPGARWTKINRKIVNPEALTIGKERFEVRDDFVIVLRVLDKEEIQAYAAATQVLRGKFDTFLDHSIYFGNVSKMATTERRREQDSAGEERQKERHPVELPVNQDPAEFNLRSSGVDMFVEDGHNVNEADGITEKMK